MKENDEASQNKVKRLINDLWGDTPLYDEHYEKLRKNQDEEYVKLLKASNETIEISRIGGMFPFQVIGTIEGLFFYYRERYGIASLRIFENKEKVNPLYDASTEVEEFRDHVVNCEWLETIQKLFNELEKSNFLYKFKKEDGSIIYSHGSNSKEAYNNLVEYSENELLIDLGLSSDELYENHKEKYCGISPTPVNFDDRIFPEKKPSFSLPYNDYIVLKEKLVVEVELLYKEIQ